MDANKLAIIHSRFRVFYSRTFLQLSDKVTDPSLHQS